MIGSAYVAVSYELPPGYVELILYFGYNISNDNQIDYDNNNKSVADYIREKVPSFNLCISCGTCASTCSAANKTGFSLRKINLLVKRGELSGLEAEIKKCMFCGKCLLVCPR